MSYSDLLERMMEHDTDAFLEMTERYGWAVYSAIRKRYPDKTAADKVYNDTMNLFYRALQNPGCDDPVEALLCAFSERISSDANVIPSDISDVVEDTPPQITLASWDTVPAPEPRRKGSGFWCKLGLVFVSAAILAAAWAIAGILMEMELIPYFDLGYSWFISTVLPLF